MDFFSSYSAIAMSPGSKTWCSYKIVEICIAVGKLSLLDWLLFTSSLGCTVFSPIFPPRIYVALLAITSFTFIFVWVPDPVCQTIRGKLSSNLPDITSSAA